jgi:AbrB family looped-hinge helix DNA binding protein
MHSSRLSRNGTVTIPKAIRLARCWTAGQPLELVVTSDGVLLREAHSFPATALEDVAGMLATAKRTPSASR